MTDFTSIATQAYQTISSNEQRLYEEQRKKIAKEFLSAANNLKNYIELIDYTLYPQIEAELVGNKYTITRYVHKANGYDSDGDRYEKERDIICITLPPKT